MPPSNGQRAETHAAFRFAVQIDGITEAVFTECTLPTLEVEVHEQPEGGLNNAVHQIPGRIKSGQREVSVIMYDSTAGEILRWNFAKAFPSKWSGPSLSSGSNQVAIEALELSYQSIDVE